MKRMQLRKKIVGFTMAAMTLLGLCNAPLQASAAPTAVDPDKSMFNQELHLIQQANNGQGTITGQKSNVPDRTTVTTVTGGSNTNKKERPSIDPFSQSFGILDTEYAHVKNKNSAPWPNYIYEIDKPTGGDAITIDYAKVGTFQGKPVDATVTFSGFDYKWMPEAQGEKQEPWPDEFKEAASKIPKDKVIVQVPGNMWGTIFFGNTKKVDVSITYKEAGTQKAIDLTGTNSYTTVGSLNSNEYSTYNNINMNDNGQVTANVFVTKNTHVSQFGNANPSYGGPVFMGTAPGGAQSENDTNDFVDALGARNYANSAVSYKAIGVAQRFSVGNRYDPRVAFTLSSASIETNPTDLEKKVTDPITGEQVKGTTASPGTPLDFRITQKVHQMNGSIIQKYKVFNLGDYLPAELEYISGHLLDESGKDITAGNGDISITEIKDGEYKGRKLVLFTGNANLMNNVIAYQQESYTFLVRTRVRKDLDKDAAFENLGVTTINQVEMKTDGVPIKTYNKNELKKSVRHIDSKVQEAHIELAKDEKAFAFDFDTTVTDDPTLTEFTFRDDLEAPFTFQSIQFFNDQNEDVTANFVRNMTLRDNEIEYTAKPEYVNSMINQKIKATMIVSMRDDYDLSAYKESVVPNSYSIITNINTTTSNTVTVKPNPIDQKIVKHFLNEKGEVSDDVTLLNNLDAIVAVGEFTIPNEPKKDYATSSVIVKDKIDSALEFRNETNDIIIKDDKDANVTSFFKVTTSDSGQTLVLTANKDYVGKMTGRTYKIERIRLYYRLGTDLSKYKDGKIPNAYELIVNGNSVDSNIPHVKPVPETNAPVKSIINAKGEKVQEYQMQKSDEVITYGLDMLVPNNQKLKDIHLIDNLNAVYDLVQFTAYKDNSKKEVIYDSIKDKEVKGKGTFTFSPDTNILKYDFATEGLQDLANENLYAEIKVKVKADADLSTLENGVIPNEFEYVVNGDKSTSEIVEVTPIAAEPKIEKKIFFDNKYFDHRDGIKQGEVINYTLNVSTPNDYKVEKLVIHDPLDARVKTTTELLNKMVITKDGKDVTNNFKAEYNEKENRVVFTLTEKIDNYQGAQRFQISFGAMLNITAEMTLEEITNIPNHAILYLNDDHDGIPSNEVTVTAAPAEPNLIEKAIKFDGKYETSRDDIEKGQAIPYALKVTTSNSQVVNKLVVQDTLDKRLVSTDKAINKAMVLRDGQDVTKDFTLKYNDKENRVVATLKDTALADYQGKQVFEINFDAFLADGVEMKKDQNIENYGQLTINDDPTIDSNIVVVNPKEEDPGKPNEIVKSVWREYDQTWTEGYNYDPLGKIFIPTTAKATTSAATTSSTDLETTNSTTSSTSTDSSTSSETASNRTTITSVGAAPTSDELRKKSNGYVPDDNNRLLFKFKIEATVNEVVGNQVVISDVIQKDLEPRNLKVFANVGNERKDITPDVTASINGQDVVVTVPKGVYDSLGTNKIDVEVETLLNESASVEGIRIQNSATVRVDDNQPKTSTQVTLNPNPLTPQTINPTEPTKPKEPTTPSTTDSSTTSQGKKMPPTGGNGQTSIVVVILLVLSAIGIVVVYKTKQSKRSK